MYKMDDVPNLLVIIGCREMCVCGAGHCLAKKVVQFLKESTRYTIQQTRTSLQELNRTISSATKIIILWNAFHGEFDDAISNEPSHDIQSKESSPEHRDNDRSNEAKRFLCAVELAQMRQIQESRRDLIVHVELQDGAFPMSRRRQASPVRLSGEDMKPLMAELQVSESEELRPCDHVAYGLAWTFSIGYLMRILTDFQQSVRKASETCDNLCRKLLVIVPRSGRCPGKVPGCETTGQSVETLQTVGGVSQRSYKNTIYALQEKQRVYHAAVEYATPVRALHDMAQSSQGISSSQHWLQQELAMFGMLLTDLTDQLLVGTKSALKIVDFDDTEWQNLDASSYTDNEELQQRLRKQLVAIIQDDLAKSTQSP